MKKVILVICLLVLPITLLGCFCHGGKRLEDAVEKTSENTLDKVQTECPVMGGEINKKFHADYEGKRVYFCCGMCPAKFKEDPIKYVKKLESEGIILERVPEVEKEQEMDHDEGHQQDIHSHEG